MYTNTIPVAVRSSSFGNLMSTLASEAVEMAQSNDFGRTTNTQAKASGAVVSTEGDREFNQPKPVVKGGDRRGTMLNFLVRHIHCVTDDLLRFVWDFGNGPEAEGTQYLYMIKACEVPAVRATASRAAESVTFVMTLTMEIVVNSNETQVVNAGVDQTPIENNTAFLYGGNSPDPDSDPTTFVWTQKPGHIVRILRFCDASVSFVTTLVRVETALVFGQTVKHGVQSIQGHETDHVKPLADPADVCVLANSDFDRQISCMTNVVWTHLADIER